jgi:(E)-4-hydroxy-3-methylbut-2-enyl-diphosphate synthase
VVRVPSVHQLARTAAEFAAAAMADAPAEGWLLSVPDAGTLAELRPIISQLSIFRYSASRAKPAGSPGATDGPAFRSHDQPQSQESIGTVALPADFLVLELAPSITIRDLADLVATTRFRLVLCRRFDAPAAAELTAWAAFVRSSGHFLAVDLQPEQIRELTHTLRALGDDRLLFTVSGLHAHTVGAHALGTYRALAEQLLRAGSRAPIWVRNTAANAVGDDPSFLGRLIESSFLTGGLLCDGIGDLLSVETEADPVRATKLAYNLLQGAGARITKTEFVACPSCGRTLFDLQSTTQRIREKTGHLKGVKIAIMGCIVNGPGEMADADFGYVGGAPGRINLYVGKDCVQYHLPQAEADERLVALIKEHGRWMEPPLEYADRRPRAPLASYPDSTDSALPSGSATHPPQPL